jgi:hypothetical protein
VILVLSAEFASPDAFRHAFAAGLQTLLDQGGLGAFILVQANASFDPVLGERLEVALAEQYARHGERLRTALRQGREPGDAPDDVAVFLRLQAVGRDTLRPTQFRRVGPWELQFNQLRAFRPKRTAGERLSGIGRPFDRSGFHFNKSFLRQETFWAGELLGRPVELLYNKFPFLAWHGILVAEREAERPQWLTEADHRYVWDVTVALGRTLPGIGLGYNAFGAYASINHLHFQSFIRATPLPVEAPSWTHNGGRDAYPTTCRVFDDARVSWGYLTRLHEVEVTYNLVYRPGRVYCFPRRHQGSHPEPAWTSGLAFYELAGGFTSFDREAFERLDATALAGALAQVDVPI